MITKAPDVVFVFDVKKEHIAVTEANKLQIPIIAVVDTNCDPDVIQYVIPGNDDAIRAGDLMCRIICDAVIEGKQAASARGITRVEVRTPEEDAEFHKQQSKARDEAAREAAAREARMTAAVEEAETETEAATETAEAPEVATETESEVATEVAEAPESDTAETKPDLEAWIEESAEETETTEETTEETTDEAETTDETTEETTEENLEEAGGRGG